MYSPNVTMLITPLTRCGGVNVLRKQKAYMLDISHIRELIIKPSLQAIGLWSQAAENLLIGTLLIESHGQYLKQIPQGPAVGLWQMEPKTYKDLYLRLSEKLTLDTKIRLYLRMDLLPPTGFYLAGNLYAACIFARLKYYFDPSALPDENDIEGMSLLWGRVYNTKSIPESMAKFVRLYNNFGTQEE